MKLTIIRRDARITEFMQAADLFEDFKVIAQTININILEEFLDECVETILEKFKNTIIVICIPGKCLYRDGTIKVISNGMSWDTVDHFLEKYCEIHTLVKRNENVEILH